jgi:nicotinamidase-related amidase
MLASASVSVLLLTDLQERLVPALHDGPAVVKRAARLAAAARMLDVPVRATEQYPAGLGPTVEQLAGYAEVVLAKTAFSAAAEPGFAGFLPSGAAEFVIAGCEAHVCVLQTTLDLLGAGHRVLLVADAVGSRFPADREAGIERARRHGADVVTSEMVLFEWLRDARHPRFRDVQKLLK